MKLSVLIRGVLGVSSCALALSASATDYPLLKKIQMQGPVTVYPFAGNPIDKTFHPHPKPSENPLIPMRQIPSVNSLPVGTVQDYPRGTLNAKFAGIGFTGFVPPDCDMAVGPNNIIVAVNTAFAVYDKKGKLMGQQDLGSLFSSFIAGGIISDPIVFYDRTSGRFFVTILNVDFTASVNNELFAVSKTADPMAGWYTYAVNTKTSINGKDFWMDYPKFGFTKDAVAYAGNMFSIDQTSFAGAGLCVLPKANLISGGTAPTVSFFSLPNLPTIEPSRIYDPNQQTIYGLSASSTNAITMLSITTPATNPTVKTIDIAVPSLKPPQGDAVAPGGHFMDGFAGDGRLFNCHWVNGHLVAAGNINNPNTGAIQVRWYDVLTNGYPAGTPKLYQSGNIPGVGPDDAFQPAVSINQKGSLGVVYSESGPSLAPQLKFASRASHDSLGTLGKPVLVANSAGSTYGDPGNNRWGDYFAVDTDPLNDRNFYVYGMVGDSSNGWATVVGNFILNETVPVSTPVNSVQMYEGTSSTGSAADMAAVDSLAFSVNSKQINEVGQVASAIATFKPAPTGGTIDDARIDFTISAGAGDTNFIFMFNWSTQKWEGLGPAPVSASNTNRTLQLTLAQYKSYLNPSTGELKMMFRAISPQHLNNPGQPFSLRLNYAKLTRDIDA